MRARAGAGTTRRVVTVAIAFCALLAGAIAVELGRHPGVRRADAAGPGFVCIWLTVQASGDLAGIISLGDLATDAADQGQPGEVLKEVSEPS